MGKNPAETLSRRERQMMDILYEKGRASAAEVRVSLPDPPSYSAVRALLRLLEEKGHLRHEQEGKKYIFIPRLARKKARGFALSNVVRTFFSGSVKETVASLLDTRDEDLSDEDLQRLSLMIDRTRKMRNRKSGN
jgi:BlaI family transcriptional regulator, penicillinase repressor